MWGVFVFTKLFWLGDDGALTRSIRTMAQTAVSAITVSTFTPFEFGAWWDVLVLSGMSGLVSVLMSLDRRKDTGEVPPVSSFPGCGESLR